METLYQILNPDFLLRNSIYTSVLIGFACPLVGVFLVMRRLVFMGVALPQISSTGVAMALSLPMWLGFNLTEHGSHSAHALAFAGSIIFTLTAILVLAFLERRGRGQPEGRLGTAYVVASALSILLLSKNPYGEIGWLDMLKGEVITISNFDLALTQHHPLNHCAVLVHQIVDATQRQQRLHHRLGLGDGARRRGRRPRPPGRPHADRRLHAAECADHRGERQPDYGPSRSACD